jgi:hypothetical protein
LHVASVHNVLSHVSWLQFELLAYSGCYGAITDLVVNGQRHYPIYSTNYDGSGKR